VFGVVCDVSNPADVQRLGEEALAHMGRVSCLGNLVPSHCLRGRSSCSQQAWLHPLPIFKALPESHSALYLQVDTFINNAGASGSFQPFMDMSTEQITQVSEWMVTMS
jgi:NAD(P)-dependent dehydrogenase (short-subunit alcohol dehydrogenase family)